MLGDIGSCSFAMVTYVGHSFLNYNITFLIDSHLCGQRNNSMFSQRPKEHIASASPLSLCVNHFCKLQGEMVVPAKKKLQSFPWH